jgi:hypothetical protein
MAGVAGPMLDDRPMHGTRFLVGLTLGGLSAGLMVGTVAFLLGTLVEAILPERWRLAVLAAICLILAVLDVRGRTPHLWRQVPQKLVRSLPPGFLGVVWGFDIGLLFTTQKVSSLLWATLAAAILLAPAQAPWILLGVALLSSITMTLMSVARRSDVRTHGTRGDRRWLMSLRTLSGLTLVAVTIETLAQAGLG